MAFNDHLNREFHKENAERKRHILINSIPHYPITIKTYDHVLSILEKDQDLIHPLGEVFMSKGTNVDNTTRIVIVKGGVTEDNMLIAMMFDRTRWDVKENPFSPKYSPSINQVVTERIYFFKETLIWMGIKKRNYASL